MSQKKQTLNTTKPPRKPAISPTRTEDFAQWYQEVIKASHVAEHALSRGCMVIKPWGYGIWEIIQNRLDRILKDTGHENAYFPLLIPLSLLEKEASHVEGFAKECAVVTHCKLQSTASGQLKPSSPLEEPYIIRPTSEAIIGHTYARWVQSHRDLPLLINQWANVVRWEMRTRMFIRTTEFLWQEGHTVHATAEEAEHETRKMLDVYENFIGDTLAIPLIVGKKTPDERFPGAEDTYTVEALMQDGKALQAGTSHFLGQNFSKAYGIRFQDQKGKERYAWTTSWGISTRLMGGLIMTHSDDDGLVLPPAIAPLQIVIQPLLRGHSQTEDQDILQRAHTLREQLQTLKALKHPLRVAVDAGPIKYGQKNWQNIKKGIPIRIDIGTKELTTNTLSYSIRHTPHHRHTLSQEDFVAQAPSILQSIQHKLFTNATQRMIKHTQLILDANTLRQYMNQPHHGWALVPWCEEALDHPLSKELLISPRCIPRELPAFIEAPDITQTACIFTQKQATDYVLFAKAY